MRRQAIEWKVGLLLIALGALAGCSPPKETPAAPTGGETKTTTSEPTTKPLKIGVVLDTGGVDDESFNAAANEGLQRAIKELGIDGQKSKYVESATPADYVTNLKTFADQGYEAVFAVGYKMEDAVKEVAPQYPNVKFILVDASAPDAPNCAALRFREEQGSFLVGYLAGAVSKKKALGFVGGEEIPLIKKFEAGYRAGAKTADPAVQVKATYTGDWNDLNKGRTQADQLFGNGVDIIFQAAGKAGLGVIRAAEAKGPGYYAIGVDRDQDDRAKGRVLTSMVKKLDNAVFDTVKRIKEGTFQPGTHEYDIKEDGVGISALRYTKQDIPAETLARLEVLKKMVAEGKVKPPTTLEELNAFQPPKL